MALAYYGPGRADTNYVPTPEVLRSLGEKVCVYVGGLFLSFLPAPAMTPRSPKAAQRIEADDGAQSQRFYDGDGVQG